MAQQPRQAIDIQLDLLHRSPALVQERLDDLVDAILARSEDRTATARERFGDLLGQTMALADLIGRLRLLMEFDALRRREQPAAFSLEGEMVRFAGRSRTPIVPKIPFMEAIEDLLSRDIRLRPSSDQVIGVNRSRAVSLAGGAEDTLRQKISRFIARALREGRTVPQASREIAEMGDFTRAYSETVYRTNLTSAFAAGRFKQVESEEVRRVTPAFEFDAIDDAAVRPNHAAADGLIAAVNDPVWSRISPPLGHNCRCGLRLVDRFELKRRGLLRGFSVTPYFPPNFREAKPDDGFTKGGRPDGQIYGF